MGRVWFLLVYRLPGIAPLQPTANPAPCKPPPGARLQPVQLSAILVPFADSGLTDVARGSNKCFYMIPGSLVPILVVGCAKWTLQA